MATNYLSFSITESSINITNNTSVVTVSVYCDVPKNGQTYDLSNPSGTLTINGTTSSFTKNFNVNCGKILLTTNSVTVTHNSNGGGTITISATFNTATSVVGKQSYSESYTLSTISRASSFTVSSSATVGSTMSYNISPSNSSFTHKIYFTAGGSDRYLLGSSSSASTGISGTYAVPTSLLSSITSKDGLVVTVYCYTFNGSSSIGYKTQQCTIKLRDTDKPSISSLSVESTTSYIWAATQSKPKISFTAASTTGTMLSKYTISVGGSTLVSNGSFTESSSKETINKTGSLISDSGSLKIVVTVYDKRGVSTSLAKTITVNAYSPPTCSIDELQRYDKSGNEDKSGAYIKFIPTWTYSAISSGSYSNTITYSLYYKAKSDSTYTSINDITLTTGNLTSNISEFLNTKSYDIKLRIKDTVGQVSEFVAFLSSESKTLSFKPKTADKDAGIAVGKIAEYNEIFEVAWDAVFNKTLTVQGIDHTITETEYDTLLTLISSI